MTEIWNPDTQRWERIPDPLPEPTPDADPFRPWALAVAVLLLIAAGVVMMQVITAILGV